MAVAAIIQSGNFTLLFNQISIVLEIILSSISILKKFARNDFTIFLSESEKSKARTYIVEINEITYLL